MDKYYFWCENFDFDINQYTIFIGIITLLLTVIGFLIAFYLYFRQRTDNSKDAYSYFESSLQNLKDAFDDTISNFEEFLGNLRSGNFKGPILSTALNDNLLTKLNLIDLKRYYRREKPEKINNFERLISDSDFFGNYYNYFVNEFNYIRDNYLKFEDVFRKWQLLRTNLYFSVMSDENEFVPFQDYYFTWYTLLNQDRNVFNFNENNIPTSLRSRSYLIENHIKPLTFNLTTFMIHSEKANTINQLANEIVASYNDMISIENSVIQIIERDMAKFGEIKHNLENLI